MTIDERLFRLTRMVARLPSRHVREERQRRLEELTARAEKLLAELAEPSQDIAKDGPPRE